MTLKELRQSRGITRKQVAKQLGVSISTIQSWEIGRRKPSLENFVALSQILSVGSEELLKMFK